MPECTNCGEDDFNLLDGHYYCNNCNTQTQEIREEEQEDGYTQPTMSLSLAKPKVNKKKEEVDLGRPWTTHEAFQVILKKQVNSLLKLGAPKQLKDVVFKLWSLYLSKCGVAFCADTAENITEKLHPRHRDKWPATYDRPRIPNKRYHRTYEKNHGFRKRKNKQTAIDRKIQETFRDEEFEEGDNPIEEDDKSDSPTTFSEDSQDSLGDASEDDQPMNDDIEDIGSQSGDNNDTNTAAVNHPFDSNEAPMKKKAKMKYTDAIKKTERMSMKLTVSFCYLGLMYTHGLVVASDFVRWIKQGKFPYLNAHHLIPSVMKLQSFDLMMFSHPNMKVIRAATIRSETGKLARFLELKDIPQLELHQLTSRYVIELNLPGDLHGFVRNLLRVKTPLLLFKPWATDHLPGTKCPRVPNYEVIAMAYIVVAVKLVLGLDDSTERELSECARELQKKLTLEQELFVWDDWVACTCRRLGLKTNLNLPGSQSDIQEISDISRCMALYENLRSRKTNVVTKYGHKSINEREDTRENMRRPFTDLIRQLGLPSVDRDTTVPDLSDEYPTDQIQSTVTNHPSRMETRDFRGTSLSYITQTEFLDELDNQGISDYTLFSSCVESGSSSNDEKDAQSSGEDQPTGRQTKKKTHKSGVSSAINTAVASRKHRKRQGVDGQQLSEILNRLKRANESYILYKEESLQEASRHKSFTFLLTACGELISTDIGELDREVQNLELVYLIAHDDIVGTKKKKRNKSLAHIRYTKHSKK